MLGRMLKSPPAAFSHYSEAQHTEAYASSLAAALLADLLSILKLLSYMCRMEYPCYIVGNRRVLSRPSNQDFLC